VFGGNEASNERFYNGRNKDASMSNHNLDYSKGKHLLLIIVGASTYIV